MYGIDVNMINIQYSQTSSVELNCVAWSGAQKRQLQQFVL